MGHTQHKGLKCDNQHKRQTAQMTLSIKQYFCIMLSVVMLCVVVLSVVEPTTTLAYYDAEFVGAA